MLSFKEAQQKVSVSLPEAIIKRGIDYKNLFVFQVNLNEPNEEEFDSFISVDKSTGEVRDFSIYTDGDTKELTKLFEEVM